MKAALRFIHTVVFWALVVIYTIATHLATCAVAIFVRDKEKKAALYRASSKLWGSLILDALMVKINISGLENIPSDTNVIYAPNHQSYVDIFILLKYLPGDYKFVIMRSLFKVPFVGRHIMQAGFIPLDRKDRKGSIGTIHRIIDELSRGASFVIFPEGQLTRDGDVGTFGRGASIIIQRSKAPVVPIAIDGTFDIMPKGSLMVSRRQVSVKIGKPVKFDDYGEVGKDSSYEFGERLRQIVIGLKESGAAHQYVG